jgi:membrane associated rhomboid family serine protease
MPIVTFTILIACVAFSMYAFSNRAIMDKYMFNAYAIKHFGQRYRFLSHAFIHADYGHLIVNMYVLYSFGSLMEVQVFPKLFGKWGTLYYIIMYTFGIYASSLTDYIRHQNNQHYNAVGASGAVSALVFSFILIAPVSTLGIFFPMPAWLFGILYLGYSFYMDRRNRDNIAHGAHAWGAVFGILFIGIMALIHGRNLFLDFFTKIADSLHNYFS